MTDNSCDICSKSKDDRGRGYRVVFDKRVGRYRPTKLVKGGNYCRRCAKRLANGLNVALN